MPPRARIWNPDTRRYVLKSGKVGKSLQARRSSPISENEESSEESNGDTTCESEAVTTEGSSDEDDEDNSCTESSFVEDDYTTSDEESSMSEIESEKVEGHKPKCGGRGAQTKNGRGKTNRKSRASPKKRCVNAAPSNQEDAASHESDTDALDDILLPFPHVEDASEIVDAHEIELSGKILSANERKSLPRKKKRTR